jgi:hypothetical protein
VTQVTDTRVRIYPAFPEEARYDLILLMDVLEHIQDDLAALRLAASKCRENGYLFITVPALQWLWSPHDEFLGHYRRYSVGSMRSLLAGCAGLEILRVHYFFGSLLPVVAPMRILRRWFNHVTSSDMRRANMLLNSLLYGVLSQEAKVARLNRLAGLSVVAVCRKRPS